MKRVIVHVGPHKTGSTAIQKSLAEHTKMLSKHDIWFCHDEVTHSIALDLSRERYEKAESELKELSHQLSKRNERTIILSQEDFSGDLIGRSPKKQVYPKLTKNLRIIKRALSSHQVIFVFYIRDEVEWLRSCYVQNLKHRTRFSDFEAFVQTYGTGLSWKDKLAKPKETFPGGIVTVKYSKSGSDGIINLLKIAGMNNVEVSQISSSDGVNKSPEINIIKKLEHINRVSEFQPSAWFAKSLIQKGWTPSTSSHGKDAPPSWPPNGPLMPPTAMPSLGRRVAERVHRHPVIDILPSYNNDLGALVFDLLPEDVKLPACTREKIEDQSEILKYHLRGKSRLAHLNALVISYLRRDTAHTDKARALFHRIWEEEGVMLINELSTRWLISTLQTFIDHGKNEAQRQIGTAGYFYANLMKIYEGERAIEGREQSSHATNSNPQTKNEFRGLDRFNVGGTDLMLNTNALALELALKDEVAGLVLQEFLLRVKLSQNVFTRLDNARVKLKAEVPGFTDTWSFFEPPS